MGTLLALVIVFAQAGTGLNLKVESNSHNYSLSIKNDQFLFHSHSRKIEKQILPCAAPAYDSFAKKTVAKIMGDFTKSNIKRPSTILITLNNDQYYLPPLSVGGVFVSKVETEIDYLISEASYRCSKK